MKSDIKISESGVSFTQGEATGLWESARSVWTHRKTVLKACGVGAVIGIIIASGTPKEYTASLFVVHERSRRSSTSGMSEAADAEDFEISAAPASERDAIYPSLYPLITKSTPFLIGLFNIEVRRQNDSTTMTLYHYMKHCKKRPWWNAVISAPQALLGRALSLLTGNANENEGSEPDHPEAKAGTPPIRLTREERNVANAITNGIHIKPDRKKKTITISVTMQDPLVAAIVTDSIGAHLKKHVTQYRKIKAQENLKHAEKICEDAKTAYYRAQEKYNRHADANRDLVKLTARAQSARLRNEMNMALRNYNRAKLQVEAATEKVEKVRPVYTVIQPVLVPQHPSSPGAPVIIRMSILLAGALSVGWILYGKRLAKELSEKMKRLKRAGREGDVEKVYD